ncbi:hypothetical protein AB2B41_15460 [Marimonas sp. MJW-29]|uniref:Uncharacterized protein n=1 Tax=Sulfitobacter sediminis TaxID=3234186 RepID=A0ABV3RRQ7_9RHOB
MDTTLGVGILAATVLLFSWAFGAHRRPDRAAWVDWPGASMLICVAFTMMGPVGLGFLVRGLMYPVADIARANVVLAGVSAGLAVVAFIAAPMLIRPALRGRDPRPTHANVNATPPVADLPRAA